ncbi:thiosulfate oxidation carrier protein SoxY [Magnetovibrio sp.]|uniref:thiosulfate oxidation carrier protein SoxY n=1 Tax=Magnetovibrio sp. TaxID=2024836 RepID=UPI002F932FCA
MKTNTHVRRRDVLTITGAGACALALAPLAAHATPQSVQAEIDKVSAGKAPKDDARVMLTLPEIAENGGTVPLTVNVESPMTDADHIKAVHIYADGNPLPDVASYFVGPSNGKAELSMRIRLSTSQNVVAVAETSTGEVLVGRKHVKVTLGGCGG